MIELERQLREQQEDRERVEIVERLVEAGHNETERVIAQVKLEVGDVRDEVQQPRSEVREIARATDTTVLSEETRKLKKGVVQLKEGELRRSTRIEQGPTRSIFTARMARTSWLRTMEAYASRSGSRALRRGS